VQDSVTKVCVVDGELRSQIQEELKELMAQGIKVYFWDETAKKVDTFATDRPSRELRNLVKEGDPFLYIFTSGTTGLPKAGKISHTRFYLGGMPVATFCYLQPGVRLYTCLPLYHSAAGMLGVGGILRTGATMVVR
jgi:fatty-acyl-CoA synthase